MPATNNLHCFFTDTDLLQPQSSGQAYGPASSQNGKDRFRTTSMHTATGAPKAYAVCNGRVFIQEVVNPVAGGPDLVNLVLSPSLQPPFELGKIKYYVYTGLLKSSFITQTAPATVVSNNNNVNKIVENTWIYQTKLDEIYDRYHDLPLGTTQNIPPASILGIEHKSTGNGSYLVADSDLIDNYFDLPKNDAQFLFVQAGDYIGDFYSSIFGFKVIVERIGYPISFGEIRSLESYIEVDSLPNGASQKENRLYKHHQESIHSYLDPAAFFGSFYGYGIYAYSSNVGQVYDIDALYDKVIAPFYNRNKSYIDARNDFGYSLNYSENSDDNIKVIFDDDPNSVFVNVNYYQSSWPIFEVGTSSFVVNNGAANYTDRGFIRLQFPRGDNMMPILYLENVRTPITFPKIIDRDFGLNNRYGGLKSEENNNYIPTVCYIAVPFHTVQGVAIANYTKITLTKQLLNESAQMSTGKILRSINYLDHLFFPFEYNYELLNSWQDNSSWLVYNDLKYVDMFRFTGQEFMAKRGVARDPDGTITFFAYPHSKAISNKPQKVATIPIDNRVERTGKSFMDHVAELIGADYMKYYFEKNNKPCYVEVLQPSVLNKGKSNEYNVDDFVAISFTSDEFQVIEQLKANSPQDVIADLPFSLYFQITDEFILPPTQETYCIEYLVLLCAYFENVTTGEVETRFYNTDIYKYHLRQVPDFSQHPLITDVVDDQLSIVPLM
jgi:hypothetical protein